MVIELDVIDLKGKSYDLHHNILKPMIYDIFVFIFFNLYNSILELRIEIFLNLVLISYVSLRY